MNNLVPMIIIERIKSFRLSFHGFFFLAILTVSAQKLYAQDEVNYSVHANIIYHFTKYVDWPSSKKTGDFVIGVVGDTPLYDELKKSVSGKKAGDQAIVVKKLSSSASFNCQILFVSEDAAASLRRIAGSTESNPVLIVTETKGAAQKGSCINFIIINDKLRLEINKKNIEQRELKIASELLQLGIQIK